MSLEAWITKTFANEEPAGFGYGWVSGTVSVFLGVLSVLAVICFRWPEYFVMEEMRGKYPIPLIRAILELAIGLSFFLAFLSAMLRRKKVLAVTGLLTALIAVAMGGADVTPGSFGDRRFYLGLDWFILTLLVLTAVFVPMERIFPYRREQSVFRRGWVTDLQHFFVSHLLVQLLTYLTLLPATVLFAWMTGPQLQAAVQSQPLWLQFIEVMIVADLAEYAIHRTFHTTPWLWRIHAVHHSVDHMDWIAGSRLHLLEIVIIRGGTFMPLYLLGFAQPAVYAYLAFVSFHAVFLHTNTGFRLGWLEHVIAMPRFHHWHHSSQVEALDKNFALHFPLIDQIFGTKYLPKDQWPTTYGVLGYRLPEGWWAQLLWPFRKDGKAPPSARPPVTDASSETA